MFIQTQCGQWDLEWDIHIMDGVTEVTGVAVIGELAGDIQVTLGATQVIGGQDGATQDIGVAVATTATTTITILMEEEVLPHITETEIMQTTEATLLTEEVLPQTETTPQTETATTQIEIIRQTGLLIVMATQISEEARTLLIIEAQTVRLLQTEEPTPIV